MQNILISYNSYPTPTIRYWSNFTYPISLNLKPGSTISMKFHNTLHCIGWSDEHGEHKCVNEAVNVKQCPTCKSRDILRAYASADFTGLEHLKEKINNIQTSLYLALFGDLVKCGITATQRLEARLKEQGADMYVELMRFPTREEARKMEVLISSELGFTERVTLSKKIDYMSIPPEESKLYEAIEKIKERKDFPSVLSPISIKKIDYHLPENISLSWYPIGEVIGAKGVFLLVRNDDKNYFVPMNHFKGHLFDFIL